MIAIGHRHESAAMAVRDHFGFFVWGPCSALNVGNMRREPENRFLVKGIYHSSFAMISLSWQRVEPIIAI
jgi:hypothetical protein